MSNQLVATFLKINTVDLTAYLKSCDFPLTAEMLDTTTMVNTFKVNRPGLTDSGITVEFVQDYGVGGPDETLSALRTSAGFPVEIRPTSAAVSPTNPKYTGTFVLENYTPISGQAGSLALAKATLKPASDVVRATA